MRKRPGLSNPIFLQVVSVMNLFQRLITFLFTLLMIAITFLFTLYSFRILPEIFLEELVLSLYGCYEVGIISLILLLFGLYLLQPLVVRQEKGEALIEDNDLGDLKVSLGAIEGLIIREVRETEGIEQVRARLKWLEDGLQVSLRIQVSPGLELPSLTSKLQSSLRNQVQQQTGVKINGVQILVEEISSGDAKTPTRVG